MRTKPPTTGGKDEAKLIEGAWLPVTAELGGHNLPDDVLKTMKLTMSDGRYTVNVGGKIDRGTIKLHQATKPKAIDITGTAGPNEGKTFLAIFELTGDTLRICYDLAGKGRPTEFKTTNGTMQFLVRHEREKN